MMRKTVWNRFKILKRALPRPSFNSLAARLFVSAALLALLILPVTGYVLLSNYQRGVEQVFDERLGDNLTQLVVKLDAHRILHETRSLLPDPRFDLPLSGWYWQMTPLGANCGEGFKSASLLSETLNLPSQLNMKADENRIRRANLPGPQGQRLRVLERIVTKSSKSSEKNVCSDVSIAVAGDAGDIEESIHSFHLNLLIALTILALGMILGTLLQVRYGLRPLRRIRRELAQIRSGEANRLCGDVPVEIAPLQEELNALIASNYDIIERARMHVGNLAHALKTPLSVITNEAAGDKSALARKVTEQAHIMKGQISHHLDRARMVARVGVIGSVVEVCTVTQPLVRVLGRIYEEKNIEITSHCDASLKFQGEKQDLEEMIGNLMDNACKWAHSKVELKVKRSVGTYVSKAGLPQTRDGTGVRKILRFTITDDGPGVPDDKLKMAVQRGKRLDESKPGSGLGLSIVGELADLYRGKFYLEQAPEGGLRCILELPAAEQ